MKRLFEEGNNLYKKFKKQRAKAVNKKIAKREKREELFLIKNFLSNSITNK